MDWLDWWWVGWQMSVDDLRSLDLDILLDVDQWSWSWDVGLDFLVDLEGWWDWSWLWDELIRLGLDDLWERKWWQWGLWLNSELFKLANHDLTWDLEVSLDLLGWGKDLDIGLRDFHRWDHDLWNLHWRNLISLLLDDLYLLWDLVMNIKLCRWWEKLDIWSWLDNWRRLGNVHTLDHWLDRVLRNGWWWRWDIDLLLFDNLDSWLLDDYLLDNRLLDNLNWLLDNGGLDNLDGRGSQTDCWRRD
jgi:hypothetical protein